TDPAKDPILMKRGLDPRVAFDRIQLPRILTFEGSVFAVLMLQDVRSEARFLIAPIVDVLEQRAKWQPICDFDDEVTDLLVYDEVIYLLANKGPPRGRVVNTPATSASIAGATEIIPQSDWVIEEIHRANDGLYLRMLDGGLGRIKRLGRDGKLQDI